MLRGLLLTQSGFARRSFIRAMRRGGELDHCDLALSRGDAFFDSLAAGNVALSREIADLSLESWRSDWEYEDDFLYRLFVHAVRSARLFRPRLPRRRSRSNSTPCARSRAASAYRSVLSRRCSSTRSRSIRTRFRDVKSMTSSPAAVGAVTPRGVREDC